MKAVLKQAISRLRESPSQYHGVSCSLRFWQGAGADIAHAADVLIRIVIYSTSFRPQGLKPSSFEGFGGTTKSRALPKPSMGPVPHLLYHVLHKSRR